MTVTALTSAVPGRVFFESRHTSLSHTDGTFPSMDDSSAKTHLLKYLQSARDALLWKLDGLSEYDSRRPLTPTGTNVLGLIKHMIAVEAGYLGDVFGRPFDEPTPWAAPESDPETDMWATPDESREHLTNLYRRVWVHADTTINTIDLDATGFVAWWPADRNRPTLHLVVVHLLSELNRHTGHADIVRELIDGSAGLREGNSNLGIDPRHWPEHYANVERAAKDAAASYRTTS